MQDLHWGIYLVSAQPPGMTASESLSASIDYAQLAERLGYRHAWVLEHHFTRYGLAGSALSHAAFILGRTTTLRVGTAINVVPLEHPLRLAEQVALIDQLSEGRLMFGMGRGTFVKDYTMFGVDMSDNRGMMDEAYELIVKAWRTGRCSADGKHYRFPEVEVLPPPFTMPAPPTYVVAQSPATIRWAAERGIPMIMNFTLPDGEKAAQLEQYAAFAEDAGFDPASVPHLLSCLAGASLDGQSIKEASRPYFLWWLEEFARASQLFDKEGDHITGYEHHKRKWNEMIQRGERNAKESVDRIYAVNPIGSPQECIDKLSRTIEQTGLRHFAFGFEAAGKPPAVLDAIQLFSEDVLKKIDGQAALRDAAE